MPVLLCPGSPAWWALPCRIAGTVTEARSPVLRLRVFKGRFQSVNLIGYLPITELSVNLIGYWERGSVEAVGKVSLSGTAFHSTIDKDQLFFKLVSWGSFEDLFLGYAAPLGGCK